MGMKRYLCLLFACIAIFGCIPAQAAAADIGEQAAEIAEPRATGKFDFEIPAKTLMESSTSFPMEYGETVTIMETIDSASRTKADPTTTSLTASVQAYDGTLKHGKMYTIVGGGYIKYMTKYGLVQQPEDIGESISRKTFTYNGRSAEPVLSDSMPEAMLDYQEERADWIFQKFEMNPDDYNYAWFYELSSYVGTDAFVTIFDIIDLPAGATSDSYFVNNAMDTVYCVFQDKDAVNYLYEFTKEDDVWQLSKVETRQDEGKYSETQQSYADYEQQLLGA